MSYNNNVIKSWQKADRWENKFMELKIGQKFIDKTSCGVGADSCEDVNVYEIVAINEEKQKVKLQLVSSISTETFSNIDFSINDYYMQINSKPFWCRIEDGFNGKCFLNLSKDICIFVKDYVESVSAVEFRYWMINELNRVQLRGCRCYNRYEDSNIKELENTLITETVDKEMWDELNRIAADIRWWKNKIEEEKIREAE